MTTVDPGGLGLVELGLQPYREMLSAQQRLVEARRRGELPDLLLTLEHPATYTRGRRSEAGDLGRPREFYERQGIEICDTPRGGRVTYHGPGQLVAYPIVDLSGIGSQPRSGGRIGVARFVAAIERAMARTLGRFGIEAGPIDGLTGIWAGRDGPLPDDATAASTAADVAAGRIAKIGSIGLLISRGISSHGLSLNVCCDLEPFEWITSCGIEQCRVTSVAEELRAAGPAGRPPSVEETGRDLADRLADELRLGPVRRLDPAAAGLDPAGSTTA
ncbi:MAG: lipoyl(octanoyl) transferase LipB [Solirubrobacterales bacterium]|nr:lipoyl(octanoyl) transferase LipB [Solirubrobacterales bacterium]